MRRPGIKSQGPRDKGPDSALNGVGHSMDRD